MEFYSIDGELKIKKIEPSNEKDLWLLHHLTCDSDVYGSNSKPGHLWNLETETFLNLHYLQHGELYGSPFAIYLDNNPIGFLDVSGILQTPNSSYVDLSYALIREARGQGYMQRSLSVVSDCLLGNKVYGLDFCECFISPYNPKSSKVAISSGFSRDVKREDELIREDGSFCLHCYTKKR